MPVAVNAGRAGARRQRHVFHICAVEIVDLDLVVDAVEILGVNFAVDEGERIEPVLAFRQEDFPVLKTRIACVGNIDHELRRIKIRPDEKLLPYYGYVEVGNLTDHDGNELGALYVALQPDVSGAEIAPVVEHVFLIVGEIDAVPFFPFRF